MKRKNCRGCNIEFIDTSTNKNRVYCSKCGTKTNTRKRRREGLRLAVIEKLGGKCKKCGFSDHRALQVDHPKGNGAKERREKFNSDWETHYVYVLKHPEKYQLLCANHNWIKRFENGEGAR